jgi:cold shock CspA family protein
MTRGSVSKLVTTHGSRWGRIQPDGDPREIFFNAAALDESADFLTLNVGQLVEFEEHTDQVNGSHAEHVSPAILLPARGAHPETVPASKEPGKRKDGKRI